MKKTVVIGASPNAERYSYKAVVKLQEHQHPVVAVGIRDGEISGLNILKGKPTIENVDTVTLYLGAKTQPEYYDYIFSLNPKRIIFNPGAENKELKKLADKKGIITVEACTLVMLSVGNY